MKKYFSLKEAKALNRPTSVAIGVFDGLHIAHKQVISSAIKKAGAGAASVVLTFDMNEKNSPKGKTIGQKIISKDVFYDMLEQWGVDAVVTLPFEEVRELTPDQFVNDILHNVLDARFVSCGEDFRFGKDAKGSWKDLFTLGHVLDMEVSAQPIVTYRGEPVSSTRIRIAIEDGDMPTANDMLGYRYSIDFQVVGGNRIGRTLGTPTINQPYPKGFVLPKFGVYATLTKVEDKWYTSVTNVGVKPSVGVHDALGETYIQNYSGDLYGKNIKVEFLQLLRREMKFDSIDELREQIHQDSREAEVIGTLYI